MYKFKKDLVLLMTSCIFLAFKYISGRRLGTGFIDLVGCRYRSFINFYGSIVNLFKMCEINAEGF